MVRLETEPCGLTAARGPQHAEPVAAELETLLAVLAHDIRSPLHTLGMSCELLASRVDTADATAARQLSVIHYTIRQIDRLVGDVLAMASLPALSSGDQSPQCNVRKVLLEAAADHRALAEASGVDLSFHWADEGCCARLDRASMLRVLANLLTNAIRFTPPGGSVEVRADRVGSEIELIVRDTGTGMTQEQLHHVFERGRLLNSGWHGIGGLGLVIVQHIAESCGGRVHAESELGRGTVFTVIVPAVAENASGIEGTIDATVSPAVVAPPDRDRHHEAVGEHGAVDECDGTAPDADGP
jgi:signal transduction histidine kinase